MEVLYVVVGIAIVIYFIVGPALGIAGYRAARRNSAALAASQREVAVLSRAMQELRALLGERGAEPAAAPLASIQLVKQSPIEAAPLEPPPEPAASEQSVRAVLELAQAAPASVGSGGAEPRPRSGESLEQALTSRWMLWLGAVALALGGAFLVEYAIDEGWLGPVARVTIGLLFGCALTGWGEWLRRRPLQQAFARIQPNYVPISLSAAGVWIAFASVYAASELYGLLPPLVAFGLLGAISVGAVFLSLLQGPFMAVFGIVGGFATPLLVSSGQPLAWGLFSYLLFIVASAFAVVRFTAAWWLAQMALTGAVAWALLWYAAFWQPDDAAPLGAFLLALTILALVLPKREPLAIDASGRTPLFAGFPDARSTVWLAAIGAAAMAFVLLRMDGYGAVSLVTLVLFVVLCMAVGLRVPALDGLAVLAAVLVLAALAAWHLPAMIPPGSGWSSHLPPQTEASPRGYAPVPLAPPSVLTFLATSAGFAALFGAGAFAALWRARRAALWASVSAATPVLLLAIAYWRMEDCAVSFSWATVAVALAALAVAGAAAVERRRTEPGFTIALAAYAAAAVAAIGLGAAMALQQAWLTVALSLELPVLAWIGSRLKITALRPVALTVALVVLARLVMNVHVLDYPIGTVPLLDWLLYGYGIPAVSFLLAATWLRRDKDDGLVTLLEAGALLFAGLLVTFEIHTLIAGSLSEPSRGLFETSLHSVAWLAMAIGLAGGRRWSPRPVALWGGRILAGGAVAQIVLVQMLVDNPLWSSDPVGDLPILNLLLLAYGVPAALVVIYSRLALRTVWMEWPGQALAAVLVFVDLSLEVRHWFQGAVLSDGGTSGGEWYAYSAAWLGFAGVLLVLGIRGGSIGLRYGSLAVLMLTVAKVFLSDMSELTGLYRVGSFVGLGLCLIGVGYLYQRFVFPLGRPRGQA